MSARYVLFCANPLDTSRVEPDFADEVGDGQVSGFPDPAAAKAIFKELSA
ncbi:MAG: hypothetical protein IIZ38_04895 [Sphingomonas sp.]|nr:hypothetical protein [Sphingomonas sp.]MBQ1497633.1 hypothetical protein [Sphingomonas sp.]